jgi:hypothetical protein
MTFSFTDIERTTRLCDFFVSSTSRDPRRVSLWIAVDADTTPNIPDG